MNKNVVRIICLAVVVVMVVTFVAGSILSFL